MNLVMSGLLFCVYDPQLRNIILQRSRFLTHIQGRHLFVTVEAIQITIEEPDFISNDVNSDSVENYYAQGMIAHDPDAFLKVCVLFKQEQGRVLTAFGVDRPKPTEEILWQK